MVSPFTASSPRILPVRSAFTWDLYGNRLINMTQLYGFWRYAVASEGKEELAQYCHLLFHLFYMPRAEAMLEEPGTGPDSEA